MKKQIKQFAIILIGVLTIIPFSSCENTLEDDSLTSPTFKVTKVSLKDLKNSPNALEKITQLNARVKDLTTSKILTDSINNFSIDTEEIILIENGLYNSYTFPIYRNYETELLENLVLSSQNDGSYQVFIMSYNITEEEKELLRNKQSVNLEGKTGIIRLPNFNVGNVFNKVVVADDGSCWSEVFGYSQATGWSDTVIEHIPVSCVPDLVGGGGGAPLSPSQPNYNSPTTNGTGSGYSSTNPNSGYSGPGGSTGSTGNTNTTGGTFGDGGTDGTGPVYTVPVVPAKTLIDVKNDFLRYNLTALAQKAWWNNTANSALVAQISAYLFANQIHDVEDTPPEEIALEMVNTLINGGDVDFENEILIDNTFKNNPKVNCIFNKMKSLENSHFKKIIEDAFGGKKDAKIKLYIQDIDNQYLARTFPYINGTNTRYYKVVLDTDFVASASALEIALAVIHELFHAELIERCQNIGVISQVLPNGNTVFVNNPNT